MSDFEIDGKTFEVGGKKNHSPSGPSASCIKRSKGVAYSLQSASEPHFIGIGGGFL